VQFNASRVDIKFEKLHNKRRRRQIIVFNDDDTTFEMMPH
jgi:hypothetical protein